VALNQLISNPPFPTPAKIFIHRLTNVTEQFEGDLVIRKKQYSNLYAVVTKRSERKSPKRQSLDEQYLIIQLEFVDEFAKQETT
jgi:hypothetical protein